MKYKIPPEKKYIVVLGGGFAGVRAALDLNNYFHNDDNVEIILVDRKDYQTYYPGLYEAATTRHGKVQANQVKRTVTIPFSNIFARTRVKVFKGYIDRIDLENGQVVTDSRIVPFHHLIIAMGSIADFYDIPDLEKYGFTLKSLEDAIMIRNRACDLVTRKDSAEIIIGGGGFAGVEFAGELHNLLRNECLEHGKDVKNFKITVVDGGNRFLSGLSEKVSTIVGHRLKRLGIETQFSSLITDVSGDHVIINMKDRLSCDLLIWTGGVRSVSLPVEKRLEHDKKDRVIVGSTLNLKQYPNVFIVGDNSCAIDPLTDKPAPQTAQEAIRQGAVAAKNIYRLVKNKPLLPYVAGGVRFVVPVSGKYAIFYTPNLIISGFFGWVMRKLADLRYLLSVLPWLTAIRHWVFENKITMKND